MCQTLIFGQDVVKSKDVKRVREPCKIRLHHAWPSSILHKNFSGLQINHNYIVPIKFRFRRNRDVLALLSLPLFEDQKMESALMPTEGLFLLPASIQAQIILKGVHRNETATIKTL